MSSASARFPRSAAGLRSIPGLAVRLVRRWWRELLALAAACGVVTATITGAMGVGDALSRGLRRLAVARLGGIDRAVLSDDFFRARLAVEMAEAAAVGGPATAVFIPAIVTEASVERGAATADPGAASRATLLACDDLTALGFDGPLATPGADGVLINAVLAESLGAAVGDAVVLRVAGRSDVPADSPLGRRTLEAASRRLRVAHILPPDGLGQFALRPAQVTGGLAVTSLATAQGLVQRGEVANAVLVVAGPGAGPSPSVADTLPPGSLRPTLDDLGLSLAAVGGTGGLRLSSRRLVIPPEADAAAASVLGPLGGRPSLAFLATSMTPLDAGGAAAASIPYSTVVGVDATSLPVGDLVDDAGVPLPPPGPGEILIDRWMADDLAAQGSPVAIGDAIELRCFLPETLHGRVDEARHVLRVAGIAAMRGAAVARELVPDVEGVTDEKSIADWDPPFPFDPGRVRTTPPDDQDDRYWKLYGATPKAFVSLETARRLAGSRFGATTAWHLPPQTASTAAELGRAVAAAIDPARMGLRTVPLRPAALAAARGSTPFGGLFLALSSFVVLAGLLLEWLLFRLLVAARRREIGLLSAVGWPESRLVWLLLGVGGIAAVVGVTAGAAVGPLWSAVLVRWLAAAWNTGVAAGSAQAFGVAAPSPAAGWPGVLAAGIVSLAAIGQASRAAARLPPLVLLRGGGDDLASGASMAAGRRWRLVATLTPAVLLAAAVATAAAARRADAVAAVGLFFLSGGLSLAGLLAACRLAIGRAAVFGSRRSLRTLPGLAWRGLRHAPVRAFSVVAIVALAEFLIVAVSAFGLGDPRAATDRLSPTGGWTFIATFGGASSVDPSDETQRATLGLSDDQRRLLAGCTIARLRSSGGDDASCTNLYAPAEPTVLGVGPAFIERGGFRFVDHAAGGMSGDNPWTLLARHRDAAGPIPAVLDQATAQWALKLGGVGSRFHLADGDGRGIELEIVGLLEPGILQGHVLVAEQDFERMFPRRSGYALALVDAGAGDPRAVRRAVARAWADAGVSVQPAIERLRSIAAVQNTFLAGFQALGTLGLLLGTAGVAAVQVQNVLERAGPLGLLRAVGFPPRRIRLAVVLETLIMVGLGLAVGIVSGCIAVIPALVGGGAGVPLGWIAVTSGLVLLVAAAAGLAAASRCGGGMTARLPESA